MRTNLLLFILVFLWLSPPAWADGQPEPKSRAVSLESRAGERTTAVHTNYLRQDGVVSAYFGTARVEIDILFSGMNQCNRQIRIGEQSGRFWAVSLTVDTGGRLYYDDETGYVRQVLLNADFSFSELRRYRLQLVIHGENKDAPVEGLRGTYDIYADGVLLGANIPFTQQSGGQTYIAFCQLGGGSMEISRISWQDTVSWGAQDAEYDFRKAESLADGHWDIAPGENVHLRETIQPPVAAEMFQLNQTGGGIEARAAVSNNTEARQTVYLVAAFYDKTQNRLLAAEWERFNLQPGPGRQLVFRPGRKPVPDEMVKCFLWNGRQIPLANGILMQ